MEKTLVLFKPDTISRAFIGKIIARFEEKGFQICGLKMMQLSDKIVEEHYAHIADKPFFPGIKKFMQSTPVIALCVQAEDIVDQMRKILGVTDCKKADTGTIRGDYGNSIAYNLVHASDSKETAEVELKRFFNEGEIFDYDMVLNKFIYE